MAISESCPGEETCQPIQMRSPSYIYLRNILPGPLMTRISSRHSHAAEAKNDPPRVPSRNQSQSGEVVKRGTAGAGVDHQPCSGLSSAGAPLTTCTWRAESTTRQELVALVASFGGLGRIVAFEEGMLRVGAGLGSLICWSRCDIGRGSRTGLLAWFLPPCRKLERNTWLSSSSSSFCFTMDWLAIATMCLSLAEAAWYQECH